MLPTTSSAEPPGSKKVAMVPPLEIRNPPLEHEPSDVALVDVEKLRHLLEREELASMGGAVGKPLVVDQADLLGHQGARTIRLGPVETCRRRSVPSLQLGAQRPKRDREIFDRPWEPQPGWVVRTRDHLSALDRHNRDLKRRQGLLSTFRGTIPHPVPSTAELAVADTA
jgi:hypothetical protein